MSSLGHLEAGLIMRIFIGIKVLAGSMKTLGTECTRN